MSDILCVEHDLCGVNQSWPSFFCFVDISVIEASIQIVYIHCSLLVHSSIESAEQHLCSFYGPQVQAPTYQWSRFDHFYLMLHYHLVLDMFFFIMIICIMTL